MNSEELDAMRSSLLRAFFLADKAVDLAQKELVRDSKAYYTATSLKMVNDAITCLTQVADTLLKVDDASLRENEKSESIRSMVKPMTIKNICPV